MPGGCLIYATRCPHWIKGRARSRFGEGQTHKAGAIISHDVCGRDGASEI